LLIVAVSVLAGCPGKTDQSDSGTPDAGPTNVSPVEMCDRLATAQCGLLARYYAAVHRLTPRDRLAAAPGEAQKIADALPQSGNDKRAKVARNSDRAPRCPGEGALLQRSTQHVFLRQQP